MPEGIMNVSDTNLPSLPRTLVIEEGRDYVVDRRDIIPLDAIERLGDGHSGYVEKVKDTSTGTIYARKTIRIHHGGDDHRAKQWKTFKNEVSILRILAQNHHFVRVITTFAEKRKLSLVLQPVADEGDLNAFLNVIRDIQEEDQIWDIEPVKFGILRKAFGCLASGLAFMHRFKVRHKDIKPQNILMHRGQVLYTDFGYSHDSSDIGRSTTAGRPDFWTERFSAPEVLAHDDRNSKSDVFSLGCVYVEILSVIDLQFAITRDFCFGRDLVRLHSLLVAGQTQGVDALQQDTDLLLGACISMTEEDPKGRSNASEVAESLKKSNDLFCDRCSSTTTVHESVKAGTTPKTPLENLESSPPRSPDTKTSNKTSPPPVPSSQDEVAQYGMMKVHSHFNHGILIHPEERKQSSPTGASSDTLVSKPLTLRPSSFFMHMKEEPEPESRLSPSSTEDSDVPNRNNDARGSLKVRPTVKDLASVKPNSKDPNRKTSTAETSEPETDAESEEELDTESEEESEEESTANDRESRQNMRERGDWQSSSLVGSNTLSSPQDSPKIAQDQQTSWIWDSNHADYYYVTRDSAGNSVFNWYRSLYGSDYQRNTMPYQSTSPSIIPPQSRYSVSPYLMPHGPHHPSQSPHYYQPAPRPQPQSNDFYQHHRPLAQSRPHRSSSPLTQFPSTEPYQPYLLQLNPSSSANSGTPTIYNSPNTQFSGPTHPTKAATALPPSEFYKDREAFRKNPNQAASSLSAAERRQMKAAGKEPQMPEPLKPEEKKSKSGLNEGMPSSGWNETLDWSYRMRTGQEARQFFRKGRVFAMMYSEAAETVARGLNDNEAVTGVRLGEQVYSQIRRFVILSARRGFSNACAISTYSQRGVLKPGCVPSEHTIVYAQGTSPTYIDGEYEAGMTKEPIEMIPADSTVVMSPYFRLRLGKTYPIEWNVKAKDIGMVHPEHLSRLLRYWDEENRDEEDD